MDCKKLFIVSVLALLMASCNQGSNSFNAEGGDTLQLNYATHLQLIEHSDYSEAVIRNPWDTTKVLQRLILKTAETKTAQFPTDATVLNVPLKKTLVYTSVHCSLISELGKIGSIGGVCDAEYLRDGEITRKIKAGEVIDCGNSMQPTLERIMELHPDAILISPYESQQGYGKIEKLGIPIIMCADYMEVSPLSRAEWIIFYGKLFGSDEAEKIFADVEKNYLEVKAKTANVAYRPRVLTDLIYSNVWYQPSKKSTTGQLYHDAGAEVAFADITGIGSSPLSVEQVLSVAHTIDFWLFRYIRQSDYTLSELGQEHSAYKRIKAFTTGNVFGCDTQKSPLFEDAPFHPERILLELAGIFHPELKIQPSSVNYYKKLKE